MSEFSHLDQQGNASMVDVTEKAVTQRRAIAVGCIHMSPDTIAAVKSQAMKKGDVIGVARIAGIQGAKQTPALIPLCHPLSLSHVDIQFEIEQSKIEVTCECRLAAKTGVEMEALTGVSTALLTLYDMCKAIDKDMVIGNIQVIEKQGGKHDVSRTPTS